MSLIVRERLYDALVALLKEYDIVDISVGTEKYFCVSRRTLLSVANGLTKSDNASYRIYTFVKNGRRIKVLSHMSELVTELALDARFRSINSIDVTFRGGKKLWK